MISINPQDISTGSLHGYLLGAVAPRPICFASTVDQEGNVNLSPYSFFNVFSANPPILIFSPARRVRDNTTKHTLENVLETREVVINIVSYEMVQQMSLSSTEYPKGVNEFIKAGFSELPSEVVKAPRVAEAPVQMECNVLDVVALGTDGGAGNLVICQVVKLHIKEEILDEGGKIDPRKIDTVARLGGNWYSRAKEGLFEVPKPLTTMGIGVDALPLAIRNSTILTGNDLGMLANVESLPEGAERFVNTSEEVHRKAQTFLCNGAISEAWEVLVSQ
ncbi:flavin reductase family protein [Altibacter sp.]|uniref:flavin reductase family protein n=1 Tax=Altibacter sp. TaxID=2024823 RepID=UPI000C91835F|nr:flavin reductase family protein [Altibacter sp.]MAP53653.1 flavin reductase [Altibacter sp.]|tara:strand:+ start:353 stop:1183 length:831 start_codon:yes stop_codon:yes gene_type:complete